MSASSEHREIRGKSRFLFLFQGKKRIQFSTIGGNQSHINILSFPLSHRARKKREGQNALREEAFSFLKRVFLFSFLFETCKKKSNEIQFYSCKLRGGTKWKMQSHNNSITSYFSFKLESHSFNRSKICWNTSCCSSTLRKVLSISAWSLRIVAMICIQFSFFVR